MKNLQPERALSSAIIRRALKDYLLDIIDDDDLNKLSLYCAVLDMDLGYIRKNFKFLLILNECNNNR